MDEKKVPLRSGEEMVLRVVEPPLTQYAEKLGEGELVNWIWPHIREELQAGQMRRWLHTPYALGELDGELVASMAYFTPTDTRDVGLIEFVVTREEHRGKGIATALLSTLVQRFKDEGGLALLLCTGNPIAGTLYENHGFWYTVGDGMRYLAPGAEDFEESYLAYAGRARIRDATWADLPRISVLYNHHEPAWLVKDYLSEAFRDTRYERHFVRLMRRVEDGRGAYLVLENPQRRVVGAAVFERLDTFFEQHVAVFSLRVCPAYIGQAGELVEAATSRARDLSVRTLQVYAADSDEELKALVQATGFEEEARLNDRLRDGDRWTDMLVYARHLDGDNPPRRDKGDYYGGRMSWMDERIAGREA